MTKAAGGISENIIGLGRGMIDDEDLLAINVDSLVDARDVH